MSERRFKKGETVEFRAGLRTVQGVVKEDRGPLGIKVRHLYLVEFGPALFEDTPRQIELPAVDLQLVPKRRTRTAPRSKRAKSFGFSIVLTARALSIEDCDALYQAGCDDGTIVTRNRVTSIVFDRKAESFEKAIRSATADVLAAGFEVKRVEMPALV